MAQYTVKAGCGHTSTVHLYGKTTERERRLAWMRSADGMCNACYGAMRYRQEVERREIATNTLREQVVAQFGSLDAVPAEVVAKLRADLAAGKGTDEQRARVAAVLDEIEATR